MTWTGHGGGISEARATGKVRLPSAKTVRRIVAFRRQKRAAGGVGIISSEEIECWRERATLDHRAALPGDVGEAGRHRMWTVEAHARKTVAQRRKDHSGP